MTCLSMSVCLSSKAFLSVFPPKRLSLWGLGGWGVTSAGRACELYGPHAAPVGPGSASDFQRKTQTLPRGTNRIPDLSPQAGVRRMAQAADPPAAGQGTGSGGQRAPRSHRGQGRQRRPESGEPGGGGGKAPGAGPSRPGEPRQVPAPFRPAPPLLKTTAPRVHREEIVTPRIR